MDFDCMEKFKNPTTINGFNKACLIKQENSKTDKPTDRSSSSCSIAWATFTLPVNDENETQISD